jgi:tetratricopeptide (TPR) repeat protein
MATKLQNYFNGLLEAIWLGSLITIPIFFNVYTSRIFEPDKTVLLRSLALISLAILLIRFIELILLYRRAGFTWFKVIQEVRPFISKPIFLLVLGIVLSYLLSSIFSVSRSTSFWGSYQRLQGTYTTLSYIVIFISIVVTMRKRMQLERFITVAILASFPVSVYGVIQRYGLDPIPWAGNVIDRIAANMGNSIFVAAFLIMVFPITITRIVQSIQLVMNENVKRVNSILKLNIYLLIGLMQLAAIYFSGSRGPWLGLGVSILVLFLGLSYILRKRWILIGGLGFIAILSLCLIIFNLPNSPLDQFKSIPRLGRLGQLLDLESRTGRVRTLIWEGASQLFLAHDPLQYPDGKKDELNIIRPLIGYGPETMFVAFNRFYQTGLTEVEKRNSSPDRSHNETWDLLIFTGVIGLSFFILLIGALSYSTFKWLKLICTNQQRNIFILFVASGTIILSIVFVIWKGFSFLGIGLPFGFLSGILVYFTYQVFTKLRTPNDHEKVQSLVLVGILAALLAHFMELIFGFGITTTRLYFWVFAGVLVVVGELMGIEQFGIGFSFEDLRRVNLADNANEPQSLVSNRGGKQKDTKRKTRQTKKQVSSKEKMGLSWLRPELTTGLIVTLISITVTFDFLAKKEGVTHVWEIIHSSLFETSSSQEDLKIGAFIILISTWFISGLLLCLEKSENSYKKQISKFFYVLMVSAFLLGIFLIIHATQLFLIVQNQPSTMEAILRQVRSFEWLFITYFLWILILIFLVGWGLMERSPEYQKLRSIDFILLPVVSIILMVLIPVNLRVVQADVAFKASESFTRPGYWPAAINIYERAIFLSPNEDYYYLFVVRAFLEQARASTDLDERERLMGLAEKSLDRAIKINPLNTDHTANMARLFLSWANFSDDPEVRQERLAKGVELYDRALELSPNNSRLWGELALIYNTELNQREKSYELLNKALELDPHYDWLNSLSGEFLFTEAESITAANGKKEKLYLSSLDAFQKSLSLTTSSDVQNRYRIMLSIARVMTRLNRIEEAIRFYQEAVELVPNLPDTWRIYEILSSLHLANDRPMEALEQAQKSLQLAPNDQKTRLEKWINEISGKP